jgi:hypothetical protein
MTVHFDLAREDVSEQPPSRAVKQGTAAGCSEALITCCALALEIRPLSTVFSREHADSIIARATYQRRDDQVLRWRQFTFETSWQIHWAAARRVVRQFYPELGGVDDLPASHWDAGLPDVMTACVTEPGSRS